VVLVPVHVLDWQGMASVGLELSPSLRFGTFMDGSLFSPYKEFPVIILGTEVETGGSCLTCNG